MRATQKNSVPSSPLPFSCVPFSLETATHGCRTVTMASRETLLGPSRSPFGWHPSCDRARRPEPAEEKTQP
jgi:hypothetical protein